MVLRALSSLFFILFFFPLEVWVDSFAFCHASAASLPLDMSSLFLFPDNSEADEPQKHSELQVQSSSPAAGASHPGSAAANIPYATPPQLGAGHAMVLSSKGPAF